MRVCVLRGLAITCALKSGKSEFAGYPAPVTAPLIPRTLRTPSQADALLRLPTLLSRYAARNLTTSFAPGHRVWTAGAAGAGEFSLDVRIRVPPHQLLLYRWEG